MIVDVVIHGVDEIKLLCFVCKVVMMSEVVVNHVG